MCKKVEVVRQVRRGSEAAANQSPEGGREGEKAEGIIHVLLEDHTSRRMNTRASSCLLLPLRHSVTVQEWLA